MIKSDMLDYIIKSKKSWNTYTWHPDDVSEELFDNLIGKWKREKGDMYNDNTATKSKLCSAANEVPEKESDGIVW